MSDVKPVAWIETDALFKLNDNRIYSVMTELSCGDRTKAKMPVYSQETVLALQAEIEALRKDAERYRWMWNHAHNVSFHYRINPYTTTSVSALHCGSLEDVIDGAIRAAIAKEKQL